KGGVPDAGRGCRAAGRAENGAPDAEGAADFQQGKAQESRTRCEIKSSFYLCQMRLRSSVQLVAVSSSTPASSALKCSLPQWIFSCSLVFRCIKLVSPLVSRTKYSFSSPFLFRYTAQSGLYVPMGVSILKRLGILKNIFTSGSLSRATATGFSTVELS